MKKNIMRMAPHLLFLVTFSLILFFPRDAQTQNAPVTTLATVGNAIPGQVDVPITVTGFNDIGAISLSMEYQYGGLHFLQGVPNSELDGFAIGDHDMGNGKHRITMGWFGSGVSLADGSAIMTITFTYIYGITALEFYENGPSCEYADANYNVLNDVPESSYYINGSVCGSIGNPGSIAGDASLCQGETGVGYSVAPVANATSYQWTTPSGATIMSGDHTNAIVVDFSPTAASGNITVNGLNNCGDGPSSQLPITVNPLPVANAGSDVAIPYGTSVTLHAASGGSGSFNYHWSPETLLVNPDLQDPQTVNLTVTTVFTLLVTNQGSLCENSDEVVVSISTGPLSANPVSIPDSICHGSTAQLFANAGGGSGNYSYAWSCIPPGSPPWTSNQANPLVTPDSSRVYQLLLNDNFNSAQGSTSLTVFQLPSATIHGGDTLCGEGNSTILTVDLTGTPPWSFYYTNGITTWLVASQSTTPYSIIATEPGVYVILSMNDAQCTGIASGSAVVGVYPFPPAPVISVNGTEIFSTGCCGNQWYKEGALIPGATGQIYQPLATAHYFDIVTVDGCSSDTSNVIYYVMTGIGQRNSNNFSVEPNPAQNHIVVKSMAGAPAIKEIKVCSITGNAEKIQIVNSSADEREMIVDIQRLSPGLYFLSILTYTDKTVVKLIVQ